MATTVSHAMRRYPATTSDSKYSNFSPLRTEDSPTLGWHPHLSNLSGSGGESSSGSGSALSRSMRYAEPWLYGSVRGAPVLLAAGYPPPAIGLVHVQLCNCTDYVTGTARNGNKKTQICKKCKGTRLPVGQAAGGTVRSKYGTVRGYPTSSPPTTLPSRSAGTVRVSSSSRPSILPTSPTVDPYDLMRRSRLSCSDMGSQFRARSTSPNKSRNYASSRQKTAKPRSPSPPKNVVGGRKSILDVEINPYELMSTEVEVKKNHHKDCKKKVSLDTDYEDVDLGTNKKQTSHIPKLQHKSRKGTVSRRSIDTYLDKESATKFKSILKKPTHSFSDTDTGPSTADGNNSNSNGQSYTKSGSHFYLPMPTFSSPRKKVQFLVENETQNARDDEYADVPIEKQDDSEMIDLNRMENEYDDVVEVDHCEENLERKEVRLNSNVEDDEEDIEDEPCRLKRSLSERLCQGASSITFNDTMALRNPKERSTITEGSTLFDAVTDLQRLDGIGPARSRPKEPPPPPPPPPSSPQAEINDRNDRPATPPPKSAIELGSGYEVTTFVEKPIPKEIKKADVQTDEKSIKEDAKKIDLKVEENKIEKNEIQSVEQKTEDIPPSAPPRKRSNSKQPNAAQILNKKEIKSPISSVNKEENGFPGSTVGLHIKDKINKVTEMNSKEIVNDVSFKTYDKYVQFKDEIEDIIIKELKEASEEIKASKKKFESEICETINVEMISKELSLEVDIPKITIKNRIVTDYPSSPVNENISTTKIDGPDSNYSYQKVKIEPSKTIVQITSPTVQIIPSTVHRLQIKNEFSDDYNYNTVSISEGPQRKTSIMINGDDCYSTVNVNDDVPTYQSSVVVNDYDSSKYETCTINRSSSVYITGDFQSQSNSLSSSHSSTLEERPKKTLVILDGNSSAPSTPSPTIINGQSTPDKDVGKTFVVFPESDTSEESTPIEVKKRNKKNEKLSVSIQEKPSSEELQRLLKDPVEAVKRNLVPHVCGKADVDRKPRKKPITSNSLVAKLLEDPFLGSLAEGLETNTVAKLIEDSLLKLRNHDYQDDDKDICSENESCPPYELMEAGSDCYSNHSNRSSVTEEELATRSKFYQMLADSALSEIEDHHYECIKQNSDPIYEEIEIPPPLPANPPPSNIIDDLQIDKQFTTRSIFEGASKYDILSYLVDAKERGIVPEESYTYNFNNSGDVIVEEEEETKNNVFSSRVSHMSTVSDSSEDSSLVITAEKNGTQKSAEVERNDSGVGSETSKCSRSRYLNQPETSIACEDCDLVVDPQPEDGPLVCKKCCKKRSERKETITEIVETEEKYSRDLQIILEEFYQPMLVAGLLTPEQLSAIFLNVEELLENSQALAERLRDTLEIAIEQGDEDLLTVNIGKIFLEAAPMLHAFESYCVRQGPASLLLAGMEKEKELLRIFLRVSQMENSVLRRMNLNSFLMVPVQRVTKYPLLLARLHKVTPLHHESRELLRNAQHKIELHLSHMNSETKDVPSKLWRRISSGSGRRSSSEMDLVNIKLRKIAVDVLEWNHDEARFALEGRLLFTQPTDNNWRKGRTIKLAPVNALLVTNGKPNSSSKPDRNGTNMASTNGTSNGGASADDTTLTFPRHTGVREAALLLVRDKGGRYSLLREPLYLDRCVIATDPAWQSYFEVQELLSKDTFIFKAEDAEMTRTWYRQLQYHAQGMGAWRKRRNALANIMINGMGSRS